MARETHHRPGARDHSVVDHYEQADEAERLGTWPSRLEFERTKAVLLRHLPPAPARVADVGGGPGNYAAWLAGLGHEVHLVDPVPKHVETARSRGDSARALVGDARDLELDSGAYDAVLLLGPLYHLPERADRLRALREARRVARPGAPVFVAAISRFASLLDGVARGYLRDPEFRGIVERDLADGRHVNASGDPRYFTTAFFHRPEDLRAEVVESGLLPDAADGLVGLEGPFWLGEDLGRHWADDPAACLDALARIESEPALLGASAHLLAVARA